MKGISFYYNDIVGDALPWFSVTGNRVATLTGGTGYLYAMSPYFW